MNFSHSFLLPFLLPLYCSSFTTPLHPFPLLLGRDEWAALRQELLKEPSNSASLEDIDSALIVVCLEEDDFTRDQAADFSHMMLHGNGINRSACVSDGRLKRTAQTCSLSDCLCFRR